MIKSAIGKDGYITGLGYLKSGAPKLPCVVHEAKVKIHNDTVCKSMLERAGGNPDEFVHAFCAGYLRGGIDTCQVCHYSNFNQQTKKKLTFFNKRERSLK